MPKQYVFQQLWTMHVLDALREGKKVAQVAEELNCTRAWIYLTLKMAGLNIADFRWYRYRELTPGARIVGSFLASKHLRVRLVRRRPRSRLLILDEGRSPLELAVHTVTSARLTSPRAKVLYFSVKANRKGVAHVIPTIHAMFVVRKEAGLEVSVPAQPARTRVLADISNLSDIEILDVLRANVRS